MKSDVLIVGGGLMGTIIARELSRYRLRITLVEKTADIAFGGATKANTGIIHAGYDDQPRTLKARFCVQGNRLWPALARDLDVPFQRTGSLVVAFNEEEAHTLRALQARGETNGVPGLEIIEHRTKLRSMEPHLRHTAVAALHAPTAAITSPYEVAVALAENARQNGVRILLNTEVKKIVLKEGRVRGVHTHNGLLETDVLINAAGISSDVISALAGVNTFSITPVKGEYFIFDKRLRDVIHHVLFPVPTPISKGIVVTHTTSGNLLIGPNAHSVDDKTDLATTTPGLDEVFEGALKLVPQLSSKRSLIITHFAGLRSESSVGDFTVESYDEPHGFINVAGIKSPGLTSAPAIAKRVIHLVQEQGLELTPKATFDPNHRPIPRPIDDIVHPRLTRLLTDDPRYGHMVCRCEHVSEGEIVEAIRRGATTLDGIKFRTRAGMGRCQGGFCTPHLLHILARELGIPVEDVTKRGGASKIAPYTTKSLLRGRGGS